MIIPMIGSVLITWGLVGIWFASVINPALQGALRGKIKLSNQMIWLIILLLGPVVWIVILHVLIEDMLKRKK